MLILWLDEEIDMFVLWERQYRGKRKRKNYSIYLVRNLNKNHWHSNDHGRNINIISRTNLLNFESLEISTTVKSCLYFITKSCLYNTHIDTLRWNYHSSNPSFLQPLGARLQHGLRLPQPPRHWRHPAEPAHLMPRAGVPRRGAKATCSSGARPRARRGEITDRPQILGISSTTPLQAVPLS